MFNQVWAERFGDHRPARAAIEASDFGRQVVGVQPDPGEPRDGGGPAPVCEGVAGLLSEAGAGQGEETGDEFVVARRVSHGRRSPRP